MRRVRTIGSWNLNVGILKLFAWSKNFNPNFQHQTATQVWIRIFGLSQEYRRQKILFAISSGVGIPICTDSITGKSMLDRSFGHYARVLIDLNLNDSLCHRILVERTGYAFFVDIEYENLPDFCSYCKCTGHYYDICKRKPIEKHVETQNVIKKDLVVQVYVQKKNKEPAVINKEPEVVNLENLGSKGRNQDDVDLEKEINEEISKRQEDQTTPLVRNNEVENRTPIVVADSSCSNGSEFVDATQSINNDNLGLDHNEEKNEYSENSSSENEHDIVQKDINFLKSLGPTLKRWKSMMGS